MAWTIRKDGRVIGHTNQQQAAQQAREAGYDVVEVDNRQIPSAPAAATPSGGNQASRLRSGDRLITAAGDVLTITGTSNGWVNYNSHMQGPHRLRVDDVQEMFDDGAFGYLNPEDQPADNTAQTRQQQLRGTGALSSPLPDVQQPLHEIFKRGDTFTDPNGNLVVMDGLTDDGNGMLTLVQTPDGQVVRGTMDIAWVLDRLDEGLYQFLGNPADQQEEVVDPTQDNFVSDRQDDNDAIAERDQIIDQPDPLDTIEGIVNEYAASDGSGFGNYWSALKSISNLTDAQAEYMLENARHLYNGGTEPLPLEDFGLGDNEDTGSRHAHLTPGDIIDEYASDDSLNFDYYWRVLIQNSDLSAEEAEYQLRNARSVFNGGPELDPADFGLNSGVQDRVVENQDLLDQQAREQGKQRQIVDNTQDNFVTDRQDDNDAIAERDNLLDDVTTPGFDPDRPLGLEDIFGTQGADAIFGNFITKQFGGAGAYNNFYNTPQMMDNMMTSALLGYALDPSLMQGGLKEFVDNGGFPATSRSISYIPSLEQLNQAADLISGFTPGLDNTPVRYLMNPAGQAQQFNMGTMPLLNQVPVMFRRTLQEMLQQAFNTIMAENGLNEDFQMLPFLQQNNFDPFNI